MKRETWSSREALWQGAWLGWSGAWLCTAISHDLMGLDRVIEITRETWWPSKYTVPIEILYVAFFVFVLRLMLRRTRHEDAEKA